MEASSATANVAGTNIGPSVEIHDATNAETIAPIRPIPPGAKLKEPAVPQKSENATAATL